MDCYTEAQLAEWLQAKGLPPLPGVDGAALFAWGRREYASVADFRAARKLQFEVDKAKQELAKCEEHEEAHAREEQVAQRLADISHSPKHQHDPEQQAPPSGDAASDGLFDTWDAACVAAWVEETLGRASPEVLAGLSGAQVLQLPDMRQALRGCSMIERRKLEHQLSLLRVPVEERAAERARSFSSRILVTPETPLKRSTTHHHFPDSNVYLFVTHSRLRVLLEVENVGKAPIALAVTSLTLENAAPEGLVARHAFVLPGVRQKVAQFQAETKKSDWSVAFEAAHSEATPTDWAKAEDEKTIYRLAHPDSSFLDASFPPTLKSLYIDPEKPPRGAIPVQWKRPAEFLKEPVLFGRPISPQDVRQGRLGNCWMAAAVMTIAAKPQLVLRLFKSLSYSPEGRYELQFFRGGRWQQVVVDDMLPCTPTMGFAPWDLITQQLMGQYLEGTGTHGSGGPVYGRCNPPNALWFPILEKAYASVNRSYQALCSGTLSESLHDLLGEPCVNLFFPWLESNEEVWKRMHDAHTTGQLMGCSTRMLTEEERRANFKLEASGIVGRHAYSVLSVVAAEGQRFVKLANPWGQFVWSGKYGPRDPSWGNYSSGVKRALEYGGTPLPSGTFWMEFRDFVAFFDEVTVCKVGQLTDWSSTKFSGVYSQATGQYGPQVFLEPCERETQILIQISKEDLRAAVGADKDNRQGIHLVELTEEGGVVAMCSSGDWSRREVTLEATLLPQRRYAIVILAQIGNLKVKEVTWNLDVFTREPVGMQLRASPEPELLLQSILADMRAHTGNVKRLTSVLFSLQHLLFYDENRAVLAREQGIPLLLEVLRQNMSDQPLAQIACSVVWNVACLPSVRPLMLEAIPLLEETARFHGTEVEMQEVIDCAVRNIRLMESPSVAMDPLIEEAIVQNVCTFTVTGDKVFLLQAWYDCFTCNLRSNYGICAVCAANCHSGHELSPPKYARFYCDCRRDPDDRSKADAVLCTCNKSSAESGLWKKRSRDAHHYNPDEEVDPAKQKKKAPKKTGLATLGT